MSLPSDIKCYRCWSTLALTSSAIGAEVHWPLTSNAIGAEVHWPWPQVLLMLKYTALWHKPLYLLKDTSLWRPSAICAVDHCPLTSKCYKCWRTLHSDLKCYSKWRTQNYLKHKIKVDTNCAIVFRIRSCVTVKRDGTELSSIFIFRWSMYKDIWLLVLCGT
jgi:hypothetical protein